jgi:allantoate deiminase
MSRRAAQTLVSRLNALGRISDEPSGLTRTFLSPAMRRANAQVGRWMTAAGLAVREDAVGNLIGRLEGTDARAGTLLLGSHLDTVRQAGRFDGALGVLTPLAALEELTQRGVRLPFAVEVLGFSEEEGVRFSSAYLGSKGYTGRLRGGDLALKDADGITVREALATWRGVAPGRLTRLLESVSGGPTAKAKTGLLGYVEVHIEQGPVLEAEKLAVGVVSAIAGQTRGQLTFQGKAGHAGTTPMALRRDALAGAAEFILLAEALARPRPPLVATVGTARVAPGAPNVIPGEASVSLDVRHPRDAARRAALRKLLGGAQRIARRRGLTCTWKVTQDNGAVSCDRALTKRLAASVQAVQPRTLTLVSGAGHDAVVMAAVAPVAMLFVRCRDGLSHHPDEYASPGDIGVALGVLVDFLERLARDPGRRSHLTA